MITYDTLLCFSMICSSTVVVFASSKGPINYLKVFVSNKKIEKPEISPIKRVASTNLVIADQGTSTRMTSRDVYMYEVTDNNGNHMTTDGFESNHVTENYDKRIVGDDKTGRLPIDDALVQRMCLDIASAVHQKISGATVFGTTASGTTASGTTAHWKLEQQQKKQQQQRLHQQQKQEQHQQYQQQKQQKLEQQKQQKLEQHQQQKQQKLQKLEQHQQQKQHKLEQHQQQLQQKKQQQQHKEQKKQQQHKEQQQHKQQPHQKPQKRMRNSYQKVSPRPVRYNEHKESAGIMTVGPDDRYNDQSVTQEISRTDYPTNVGTAEEDMDDNKQDEDADHSPKVWEVNMVDDQVVINSAKSQEQRSEAFTAATSVADDYDDGNLQTS